MYIIIKELNKVMEKNNFIGRFYPLACDLTDENDILKAFKWIDENIGGIHFMINNAGIVRISTILGQTLNDIKIKINKLYLYNNI